MLQEGFGYANRNPQVDEAVHLGVEFPPGSDPRRQEGIQCMKLTEALSEHGVEYRTQGQHHHVTRGWLNTDCPQCSPGSGKFRLGFNIYGKYWNCWTCGSVPIRDVFSGLFNLDGKGLKDLLSRLDLEPGTQLEEIKRRGNLKLPSGLGKIQKPHREYLEKRGFNVEELQRLWNIGGLGVYSRLAGRIFIPITYGGNTVSWTTRSISDGVAAKYITAKPEEEEVSNHEILGGEDYCRHAIIVNEGPLDAMAIGPGAVWTGGVGYSRAQLLRIAKYPVRVIVFDNEVDAQRRARKLCDALSVFSGVTYNARFLTGKDASRAQKCEIAELRRRFLES